MSFLSDLFEGNVGNLGHDLTAHLKEDLPLELAAVAAPFAAFGLPEILGGAGFGAGGLFGGGGGLFGGAAAGGAVDAAAGLGDAADALGSGAGGALDSAGLGAGTASDALSLTGTADSFTSAPGIQAINSAVSPAATAIDPSANVAGAGLSSADSLVVPEANTASSGGFLSKLGTGALDSITKNPLGLAAGAAGLGLAVMNKNQQSGNEAALSAQAAQLGAQGQQLMSYLQGGTLPPALKASLDQATAAAKARIISNHAANGMSTDPSQNSALAQELNAADTNAVAAMAQTQINMMQTGLNETGLSTQLYAMLTNMDRADNTALMTAISNFASSLGGSPKGVTLKLA